MLYDREKIVALRVKLGISINELARRVGIAGPSMHAIEKGRVKEIRASTLIGIANALGVRVQDIIHNRKRANGASPVEAASAFNELTADNQQAALAAILALLAQQKKKKLP